MLKTNFRRLTMATAAATYLLVVLGGAGRAFWGSSPGANTLLEYSFRLTAFVAGLLALAAAAAGRETWLRRPAFLVGAGGIAALSVPALLGGVNLFGLLVPNPGVAAAFIATWMVATVLAGGEEGYPSRLSMFRSQWQVPLWAAMAAYVVVLLGSYLRALGAETACHGWPLCDGLTAADLTGVVLLHLAHRAAAALSGFFLMYTVVYVWRRHLNRPVLLVLTGVSVVLFTTVAVLGADAARGGLSPAMAVGHLAISTALIGTLLAISAVGYYAPTLPAIAGASVAVALPVARPLGELARDYFETMKPRLVLLLVITGYCAMWVAARGLPSLPLTIVSMTGLFMSCGAANAINMWYDQDIDRIMKRTQKRPIPSGRLTPSQVLGFGILTGVLSFVLLALAVNLMTALLSLAGLLFYVCIYTMWLKRSTDLNTVVGGVAGAIPPMVGWAAITGQVSWASVAMFLIVFAWQPPHFWALALYRNDDYRAAHIPMLPVTRGEMHTKWQILIWTVLIFPTVAALYWTGVVGQVYLWVSLAATAVFFGSTVVLFFERLPQYKWARKTFFWSLYWMAFVFIAMVVDVR
jgi:heme o synthase